MYPSFKKGLNSYVYQNLVNQFLEESNSLGIFDNLISLVIRDLKIEVEIHLLKGSIWESIARIFILLMSRT